MLTPETIQGGQDAVPDYGCKMPPTRLVLPPWFPNWPLTNRASWNGATRSTGYEFAGHDRPEQRGTALAWNQEIPVKTAPILPIDNSPYESGHDNFWLGIFIEKRPASSPQPTSQGKLTIH